MTHPIKVLVVEDSPADAELALNELSKAGIVYLASRVDTRQDFIHALETFLPDIVLSDFSMPAFDGLSALKLLRERDKDTPFIFVSGTIPEDFAVQSLKEGATDYVLKTNLRRLAAAVERAIIDKNERVSRREAQAKLQESLERLHLIANYDTITSLPGRTVFCAHLNQLLQAGNAKHKPAMVVIDIERFRLVNDSLGWSAGSLLLEAVAQRLMAAIGAKDAVCRVSADVFAFLCEALPSPVPMGDHIYDYVLNELRRPVEVMGNELRLAFKYGVALYPEHGGDAETLLHNAELALGKAKNSSDRYLIYSPTMHVRSSEFLSLENKLRVAIADDQFVLHYQPIYDIEGKSITGIEALVRWDSPELGRVPPAEFMSILEQTRLILDIGSWVLQQAVGDWREWRKKGIAVPRIAINVSPHQLHDGNFVREIAAIGNEGIALDLEITESTLMEQIDEQVDRLAALRESGIGIQIDDFGTGYSSLSYIANLPVTGLKIDRSFVARMSSSKQNLKIIAAIVALATSLDLYVTAEGVETREQWEMLKNLKCHALQGYLLGRPLPADQMASLLQTVPARESRVK